MRKRFGRFRSRAGSAQRISGHILGADFDGSGRRVDFDRAVVEDVNFLGSTFGGFYSEGSTFLRCDFSRVKSQPFHGVLSGEPASEFVGCTFRGARLDQFSPGAARFEDCSFEEARIAEWFSADARFIRCDFSGATISKSNFFGPGEGSFVHNDFREAKLVEVQFLDGVRLKDQFLPSCDPYMLLDDFLGRVQRARHTLDSWSEEERREADLLVEIYSVAIDPDGSVFLKRDDIPDHAGIRDRFWRLLRES